MPELLDVSPTRGNLLRLKDELGGIRTRHDLLDRKREVLVRELMQRLEPAEQLEREGLDLFRRAHEALQLARMRIGSDRVDRATLAPAVRLDLDVASRTIMGLRVPAVDLRVQAVNPPYGLDETSAALDEARERWIDVARFLARAAGTFTAVWRLAVELNKTQRQVNALESTLMPRYEQTIAFISGRLEEDEREDIVHARKVKEMREGGGHRG